MTDLSPNAEVVLTSDLFNDDPCFESMSDPAWAVLDAYMAGWGWLDSPTKKDCRGVAAALRAAAQQIEYSSNGMGCLDILRQLATELENQ